MKGLFKESGIPSYKEMAERLLSLQALKYDPWVSGRIARLPGSGTAIFVGDLHGDLEALISIIKQVNFLKAMESGKKDIFLVFLGDYGCRGWKIIETINELLLLKLRYPTNVILQRGNHEDTSIAGEYGTGNIIMRSYPKDNYEALFALYCATISLLPVVTMTDNGIIGVHSGIPNNDITSIDVLNGDGGDLHATEMTWNDPVEKIADRFYSPRGFSFRTFGKIAFDNFMRAAPAKLMVRSHEAFRDGVKFFFNNRLASIFSNGGLKSMSSYYHHEVDRPVFLQVDLSEKKDYFEESGFHEVLYLD